MSQHNFSGWDKALVYTACAVLIVLSLVFYKERVIYSDTAQYAVHILSHNSFDIGMYSRYIGGLTQVLPLLAFRCHASLSTILILYSLNFMLVPVGCALLSVHWFRETRTAWSILLFTTLMASMLFYYPVSEYQSGLCVLLFYNGAFHYFQAGRRIYSLPFLLLSLLLIPTVIFSHPLAMPVFASWILLRLFIDRSPWRNLVLPLILVIAAHVIKITFFHVVYEDMKMDVLKRFEQLSLANLSEPLGRDFLKVLTQDYFLLPVLAAGVFLALLLQKRVLAATAFILALAGWWVLITVSFLDAHYNHYFEHMYQAIPFFIALYSCTVLIPVLKPVTARLLLTVLFIISVFKINSGADFHRDRFAWLERSFKLMDRMHCKKAAVDIKTVPGGVNCPATWSIPYESLLLSSIQDRSGSKSIMVTDNLEKVRTAPGQVYYIDVMPKQPLVSGNYFDISGYSWCIPEDHYPSERISKIMYGTISE